MRLTTIKVDNADDLSMIVSPYVDSRGVAHVYAQLSRPKVVLLMEPEQAERLAMELIRAALEAREELEAEEAAA